ncbi:MAG: alanine--tRNA ligase [Coriobacteriia bacterium]|nr:alanine--tRNA ligase [Coriobacteriia bacterium]
MKYMTSSEIREKFLSYFEDKGCKRMHSSSLIPDDPSLLLTSAGMVQFKPYFLQQKKLPSKYVGTTTAQKCVRTNDIDIIGRTGRHLSFFEMLGNFSFGAYFKREMCDWAIDFSVNAMGLDFDKLWFSVYKDDDESIEIWKDLGVPEDRIVKLGEEDNFWRAGPTGPCGPCSELYYDQGPEFGCGSPDCAPGCDCDRYLEYWNLVFTQYDGQEDGTLLPLPKKNIDTGMGLERMAAILQGVQSNFETDILRSLVGVGEKLFNVKYGDDEKIDLSLRIIADHSRAVTFMIADGILPGNEGREYVLRRLLRRCVIKAYLLGFEGTVLNNYIEEIFNIMGDVYPELIDNKDLILRVVKSEEERFGTTLRQGTELLDDLLNEDIKDLIIPGEDVFILHDTYGFPMEVTKEIAEDRGFSIDEAGFNACMEEQRSRARAANAEEAEAAWDVESAELIRGISATKFVGYDTLSADSKVVALVNDNKRVDVLKPGETGVVFVEKTPFYGEMGGQVGDQGKIYNDKVELQVTDTFHPDKPLYAHKVKVIKGALRVDDKVSLEVDKLRRSRISRNHTATHILHWALRNVLGDHVKQAGSYVAPDRLRFDFTHFEAMTRDQIAEVEKMANDKIMEAVSVATYNTSLNEARKSGVTALFGEKYGDEVRVVNTGDFSSELCGGCHVSNTSEIGLVKVTIETSVGANARRIEAVTSFDAYDYCTERLNILDNSADILRCPIKQVPDRIEKNIADIKRLNKDIEIIASKAADDAFDEVMDSVFETEAGYKLCIHNILNLEGNDIKRAWDLLTDHGGDNIACVVGGINNGKALLLAAGTDKAVQAGFNAVDVIKAISKHIQGGGGGKPRMAQAGGKNIEGIDDALNAAREMLS